MEEAFALETQDGIGAIDGAAAETLVVALPAFVGPEKNMNNGVMARISQ
ncbi:hypothetical protein P0D88_50270 [Paraburkholderia sp. RL18-103-BIB-C]